MGNNNILAEGDGFRLRRRKEDDELVIDIAFWSAGVETAFHDVRVRHVEQKGSWLDGTPVLTQVVRFASQIKSLVTDNAPLGDASAISELSALESLFMQQPGDAIAYSRLTALHSLKLWKGSTLGSAVEAPALRDLTLWSIGAKSLHALSGMTALRRLELRQMLGVRSLEGIETLALEQLDLTYVNRLESIAPVGALSGLRSLEIDGASKAEGGEVIGELSCLERLVLDNGPLLPNLETCGSLTELRVLRILNTPIGNGPCSVTPLSGLEYLRQLDLIGRPRSLANLRDLDALGKIGSLVVLNLDRVGDLPSIEWVKGLKRLRVFGFGGGAVLDGDLSPFLQLPELATLLLDMRGFEPGKSRYTPEFDVLMDAVRVRALKAPPAATATH